MNGRPAVFFDRDGVLNPNAGYPHVPDDARLFDDVAPALHQIKGAGFLLFVVTNQSGVARGFFTLHDVEQFNVALCEQLRTAGIYMKEENFYVCPHGPEDSCECRKPKPGLLLRAAQEHNIDLGRSACIGDSESDIEAGQRAGVFAILLDRGGSGRKTKADAIVSDLVEAAKILVQGPVRAIGS
jgi:histidinol-phosphate phosphatase family protein